MACAGRSARLFEISATSEERGWEPRADDASAPQKAKATWGGQFLVGQAHGLLRALRPALRKFSNIRRARLGARADDASAPQSKGNLGRTVLVGQAHGL